ncbi:MAG: GTP pyrophosphokinase family protein [Clostridiales bacterium]|jgi:putative GTP pyrophosphokinase|nr:GTP pyrophosphokinase family protein [Clostridiales bacterium]
MNIIKWEEFLIPYEQAVDELTGKFRAYSREMRKKGLHCPIEYVEGRVKKVSSILEKAHRKGIHYGQVEERMEDIAGVRIICRFVEDIQRVAAVIRERNGVDMEIIEEKDYISDGKSSGYRSYHINIRYPMWTVNGVKSVAAEIQIRTMAMNFWATIEHSLKYKYNHNIPRELQKRLISAAEASYSLDVEMSAIREEIMEVQRVLNRKNDLVDEIIGGIGVLYTSGLNNIEEIHARFLMVYEQDDLEKLLEFKRQLEVLSDLYKATPYKSFSPADRSVR